MKSDKGFTLLELQVSIALLLFSIAGLAGVLMNNVRQIETLESKRPLYAFVPTDEKKVIFTECTSAVVPSNAVYRVTLKSLESDASSITAEVELEERGS